MKNNRNLISTLQNKAISFLKSSCITVNGADIYPKEIEVYYYETGAFEDVYVHRDERQKNHPDSFYVHRKGRGGCDFVVSSDNTYYSYLLRSVVIDNELIVGPQKTYEAICCKTGLYGRELESADVAVSRCENAHNVFTTERIGLNPAKDPENNFFDAELRFIICDEYFKPHAGYKGREAAFGKFMKAKLAGHEITKEQAMTEARTHLGYVPKWLKEFRV